MPDFTQTNVQLQAHTLITAASGEGISNIDLFRSEDPSNERATATANTVQMLKSIRALATSALGALDALED